MYKFISILLASGLFLIFVNKWIGAFVVLAACSSILIMIKEKKIIGLLIGLIIVGLAIYNYNISKAYFYMDLENLNVGGNIQYAIRALTFLIMLYIFSDTDILNNIYENFKNYSNFILIEVIIAQLDILYLLISGKGYSSMWGLKVFIGRYVTPHPYGYSMIIMVIIIEWLIMQQKDKRLLLLYILPFLTSFLTGARTPLIAMLILFLSIRFFKREVKFKREIKFKTLIIIIFGFFILIVISPIIFRFIVNSNIIDKFLMSLQNNDITSGRSGFWKTLLLTYVNQFTIIEKLFGHGINYPSLINMITINHDIWAHSDFIDILISYGLIFVIIYTIFYLRYFYKLKKMGTNTLMVISLLLVYMFLSIGNGIINYNHFILSIGYLSIYCKTTIDIKDELKPLP